MPQILGTETFNIVTGNDGAISLVSTRIPTAKEVIANLSAIIGHPLERIELEKGFISSAKGRSILTVNCCAHELNLDLYEDVSGSNTDIVATYYFSTMNWAFEKDKWKAWEYTYNNESKPVTPEALFERIRDLKFEPFS